MKIPFNKPSIVGKELEYIQDAVNSGSIASGGKYTQLCESFIEERYSVPKVMLTTSCTDALELAALLLDIQPGDKVLVPAYTYVSTANAFALRGAEIHFVDCDSDTLNLSLDDLKRKIDDSFKLLVVMHYAGVPNPMDEILTLCNQYGVEVVEDAALAIDSSYKGKQLGTWGKLGVFSFHQTKTVISGEGGAILINDEALIKKAYIHRDKGTDRQAFFNGEVDRYRWKGLGSSYAPTDMVSAYLWGQLEKIDDIISRRKSLCDRYHNALHLLLKEFGCSMGGSGNGSIFFLMMENEKQRDALIEYLKARNIKGVFHYQPLHVSPFIKNHKGVGECVNAVQCAKAILRLPLYLSLSKKEQDYVIETVSNFFSSLPRN